MALAVPPRTPRERFGRQGVPAPLPPAERWRMTAMRLPAPACCCCTAGIFSPWPSGSPLFATPCERYHGAAER